MKASKSLFKFLFNNERDLSTKKKDRNKIEILKKYYLYGFEMWIKIFWHVNKQVFLE